MVKRMVKDHSSPCSTVPYVSLRELILSSITTMTLRTILTISRTSKFFPAFVSASKITLYNHFFHSGPSGLFSFSLNKVTIVPPFRNTRTSFFVQYFAAGYPLSHLSAESPCCLHEGIATLSLLQSHAGYLCQRPHG